MSCRGVYISEVLSQAGSLRGRPAAWEVLMRYAAVTLLLVLLNAAAVRAQSPAPDPAQAEEARRLYELVRGGHVTFTLPESWSTIRDQSMNAAGLFQKTVNYPVEEAKEPGEERNVVARITLSTIKQEYRSLKEMWDSRPQRPLDFVILSSVWHGANWRTLVTKGVSHGVPHVSLSCDGLVDKQYAGLGVMLYTDGRDPKLPKQAVEDFNAVCESLKINGKNQLDTKLDADKLLELLGAGAKK